MVQVAWKQSPPSHSPFDPVSLPSKTASVGEMRGFLSMIDTEDFMVTLVKVEKGYEFLLHPRKTPKSVHALEASGSKRRRCFKNVESALNVARSLGFSVVAVQL